MRLLPQRAGGLVARVRGRQLQPLGAQRLRQHLLAQRQRLLLLEVLQVVPDLGACAPGAHDVEPARVGARAGRGDDLDHVAALELGAQCGRLAVDRRGHRVVADVGVDRVGEVDRRGAARQRQDAAHRREDVDRVREQVDLDVLEELGRVARLVLDVQQRLQPHRAQALRLGRGLAGLVARLVQPVRGDALLGHRVHRLGAHLELHRRAQRADQRRVQRLVAVGLGDRDVVLEAPGHRLVELVQHAQRPVAVVDAGDDDAEAEDVVDLCEALALVAHLAVDRIQRLLAPADLHLHARAREGLVHVLLDALDDVAPGAARSLQRLGQRRLAPGVDVREAQVLQLAVDLVETQSVRDRGVDLERLARDAPRPVGRHRAHRAHVVQPVGELDEDDAHVARHRQQHLAERLGLPLLARVEAQPVELGQPVDQLGGRGAEVLDQGRLADTLVLDRVVHQRGHDRLHVQPPLGAQAGDRGRVRDVGLAAGAELPQMRLVGELVGLAHALQVRLAQVGQPRGQAVEGLGRLRIARRRREADPLQPLQRAGQQFGGERANPHAPSLARIVPSRAGPQARRLGRGAGDPAA